MKKRKLKKKFIVFLSLYALFFVSYFTLTTFAKYTTSLDRNGDVLIAKWDVSIEGEDNKELPTMFLGNDDTYQSYNLSVTSRSEIALTYSVIIKNVPDGVKIQVDDNTIYSAINNTINIENLGSFDAKAAVDATSATHNHKLTIHVPLGIGTFDRKQLDIDVIFTQVDL